MGLHRNSELIYGTDNHRSSKTSPRAGRTGVVDQELCLVHSKQGSGYETPALVFDLHGREEHDGAGGSLAAATEAERRA